MTRALPISALPLVCKKTDVPKLTKETLHVRVEDRHRKTGLKIAQETLNGKVEAFCEGKTQVFEAELLLETHRSGSETTTDLWQILWYLP